MGSVIGFVAFAAHKHAKREVEEPSAHVTFWGFGSGVFLCAFVARAARRGAAERDAGFVIVVCGVKWTPALALAPNWP